MRCMVSCGEASGDLYAGALAAEIRNIDPAASVFGFGGDRLRAAGGRLLGEYRGLAVTGLTEALRVVPRSLTMYRRLVSAAQADRPDVLVAIDFPDFNLKLASAIQRLGIPVIYYVTPQLWAWRPKRLRALTRVASRLLVIFPFEPEFYRRAGVDAEFVGHPLVDLAVASQPRDAFLGARGLNPAAPTVALLPGSRSNEVQSILPAMAGALPLISARIPTVQFVIAKVPTLADSLFASLLSGTTRPVVLVEGQTDEVLASSDVAVTASGTATVQAAIHECPMVIVYRLSPLTYRMGKPFVRVDTYGMVNIVAGDRIVPELIQDDLTPGAIARETLALLEDPDRAHRTRARLREVRAKLGSPGVSRRVAERVFEVARSRSDAFVRPA
jgi:lipid-A-disaccharide synthase